MWVSFLPGEEGIGVVVIIVMITIATNTVVTTGDIY